MKTAEAWRKEYKQQQLDSLSGKPRTLVFRNDSFVKAIQLDALKEGMRRASKHTKNFEFTDYNCAKGIEQAILTAAEQLTEKDL